MSSCTSEGEGGSGARLPTRADPDNEEEEDGDHDEELAEKMRWVPVSVRCGESIDGTDGVVLTKA